MLPNFVPDEETLQKYVEAGRIASQALQYGKSLIKEGAVVKEVLDEIEEFIKKSGAGIAFPAQISINKIAAHFCPMEDDDLTFKHGDVVKLDVGAHIDGYVGDNALTVNLAPEDKEKELLVQASRAARDAAIAILKDGVTPNQLGEVIEKEITKRGFQPVKNLSGHGLGKYEIHTSPSIPNYANNDNTPLREGHVIAIEPFATTGTGMIKSSGVPSIFSLTKIRPVRNPLARKVLEELKKQNGLPFTLRWLTKKFGKQVRLVLTQLKQLGIVHEYYPLAEVSDGIVSQAEHTILIEKDGARILTVSENS